MRTMVLIGLLALPAAGLAQTGGPGPGPGTPATGADLNLSVSGAQLLKEELGQGQGSDLGTECQALLEQIDALKGAPLRRSALLERYREECQSGLNATPPYAPPLPQ